MSKGLSELLCEEIYTHAECDGLCQIGELGKREIILVIFVHDTHPRTVVTYNSNLDASARQYKLNDSESSQSNVHEEVTGQVAAKDRNAETRAAASSVHKRPVPVPRAVLHPSPSSRPTGSPCYATGCAGMSTSSH
jgi:hypothetical protein